MATRARSAPVPLPFGVPPVARRRPGDGNTLQGVRALSAKPWVLECAPLSGEAC